MHNLGCEGQQQCQCDTKHSENLLRRLDECPSGRRRFDEDCHLDSPREIWLSVSGIFLRVFLATGSVRSSSSEDA